MGMLAAARNLILGDLPRFATDPLGFVENELVGQTSLIPARFAHRKVYFSAWPADIRHILVDAADKYDKGQHQARMRSLFGDGMITARGQRWSKARSAARPNVSGSGLERGIDVALGILARELSFIAGQSGRVLSGHELAGRLTLRMATAALFHHDLGDDDAERAYQAALVAHKRLSQAMWRLIDLDAYLPTSARREYVRAVRDLEAIAAKITREHKGAILTLKGLADEHGQSVYRDEIITMLVAGFETTAQATAWLFYVLASRSDLMNWIREEVDPVLSHGSDIRAADLKRLHRVRALVDEVLRHYPSAWWFAREAVEDDVVGGISVTKGSCIFICPWALHRQPDLWFAPRQFDPSRFLSATPEKFSFLPFGIGARACVGMHLARAELMAIGALVAATFDLAPASGRIENLKPIGGVTLAPPAGGLRVAFTPRKREERKAA